VHIQNQGNSVKVGTADDGWLGEKAEPDRNLKRHGLDSGGTFSRIVFRNAPTMVFEANIAPIK
jgi:hypothetical protein